MERLPRSICLQAVGLFAALGFFALSGKASEDELGEVVRVHKTVKAGEQTLEERDEIQLGPIQTFRDSAIEMTFDGDGRLLLWPSTKVLLQKPGPADDRHTDCNQPGRGVAARIELQRGGLQVDHDPKKVDLKPRVLEVETRDGFICLFGTSIQVHADPDLGTGVFVRETGAWVRHADKRDWKILRKGEQTWIRNGDKLYVTREERLTLPDLEGRFNDSPLLDPIIF